MSFTIPNYVTGNWSILWPQILFYSSEDMLVTIGDHKTDGLLTPMTILSAVTPCMGSGFRKFCKSVNFMARNFVL